MGGSGRGAHVSSMTKARVRLSRCQMAAGWAVAALACGRAAEQLAAAQRPAMHHHGTTSHRRSSITMIYNANAIARAVCERRIRSASSATPVAAWQGEVGDGSAFALHISHHDLAQQHKQTTYG